MVGIVFEANATGLKQRTKQVVGVSRIERSLPQGAWSLLCVPE